MTRIPELVDGLFDKDNTVAYKYFKELLVQSEKDDQVYPFFDIFADMLDHDNSYIRTRGLLLVSANAKWDADYKIDEVIDKYLTHIIDEKAITARQCIKALPEIAKYKTDLIDDICSALKRADSSRYPDSMQPLVQSDINQSLELILSLR